MAVTFENGKWIFRDGSMEHKHGSFDELLKIVSKIHRNAPDMVQVEMYAAFDRALQAQS